MQPEPSNPVFAAEAEPASGIPSAAGWMAQNLGSAANHDAAKPENPSQANHWSGTGKLRGGRAGIWFFIVAWRMFGLHVTYLLLIPPAIYFSLVSPDIAATMNYHERVFGRQPWWKRRWLVFRHFYSFGRALLDRTAILGGDTRHFTFSFEGEKHLREAVAEGRGTVLLTAHLGNWEAAGQLLSRIDVPINVVGFDLEFPAVRSLLQGASKARFRLMPLTGSSTDTIPLVAALRRGEVVAMLGDRGYGSRSEAVPFLGGMVKFPVGAYALAAVAGAPLIHVFNMREPGGHYHCYGFPPQRPKLPPREERNDYLRDCAQAFAHDLQSVLRRDPLQWYNFYPFWEQPGSAAIHQTTEAKPCLSQ